MLPRTRTTGLRMKIIYDVGAHKGEDTDYYLKKGFRVVAVEANPTLAQGLRDRFPAALASGQLTVVASAIAEQDGEVTFFLNENTVWGTIYPTWAERNEKMGSHNTAVTVPAVSFGRLLREHGVPHYLKIDIEGADMLCVQGLAPAALKPAFVSIESNKTSWKNLVAEFDELRKLGYTRFKVVNQVGIPEQKEPQPAREGLYAGHQFPEGSTGLFGDDLPGKWVSRQRALLTYAFIFMHYALLGDNTFGKRIAGRLPLKVFLKVIPGWYDTHAARG